MEKQQAKFVIKRLPDQFGDVETKIFLSSPPKSQCSSAKNLVGYGTIGGFAVFRDTKTLEFVLMPMEVESTIANADETLTQQIGYCTNVLGKKEVKKQFVELGLAQYVFPEIKKSGYYVLQKGLHTWQKKKLEKKVEEKPEPAETNTVSSQAQSADDAF